MEHQHCAATAADAPTHCEDHSGQIMWMRGIAALMTVAIGLLSYSVFWQAPALRTQIATESARVDGEIRLVKKDVETLGTGLSDLKGRVDKLESREAK